MCTNTIMQRKKNRPITNAGKLSDSDDISETSSDENEPSTSHSPCLSDSLSQWTSEFQIKHNAVDSLLKILSKNDGSNGNNVNSNVARATERAHKQKTLVIMTMGSK